MNTNSSDDRVQLVIRKQKSRYSQNIRKVKHMFERQKTTSAIMYSQLNKINERQIEYEFDYFKSFNDFRQILVSIRLDLDLLSDSMAVQSCYVLSKSMNLGQEVRDDLSFYYKISLVVLFISILPKLNCYLFIGL